MGRRFPHCGPSVLRGNRTIWQYHARCCSTEPACREPADPAPGEGSRGNADRISGGACCGGRWVVNARKRAWRVGDSDARACRGLRTVRGSARCRCPCRRLPGPVHFCSTVQIAQSAGDWAVWQVSGAADGGWSAFCFGFGRPDHGARFGVRAPGAALGRKLRWRGELVVLW
jgi:hypothetical protein